MAVTLQQTKTGSGTTATTLGFTISPTAGNTLILCFSGETSATARLTISSISGVATWTQIKQSDSGTVASFKTNNEIWIAKNVPSGISSITVNLVNSGATGHFEGMMSEWSGLGTGPTLASSNTNSSSATDTITTNSVTPGTLVDLVIASMCFTATTPAYSSGPINSYNGALSTPAFPTADNTRQSNAYLQPGSTSSTSTGWTYTGSTEAWDACIVSISPTKVTTTQTLTGVANIALATITTTQTLTGVANIRNTTSQTLTGVSRITGSTSQTLTGVAKITATTSQTQFGVANIRATSTQTLDGVSRIQITSPQTLTGVSRVQVTTTQTLDGVARIGNLQTTQTLTGVSNIINQTYQTLTGKASIQKTTSQTLSGKAFIQYETSQTLDGISRIQASTLQTETGIARITNTTSHSISGQSRITVTTLQTLDGHSRIAGTTSQTLSGVSNVRASTLQTLSGLSRITASTSKTLFGKANIRNTTDKTLDGKASISNSVFRELTGVANIATPVYPWRITSNDSTNTIFANRVTILGGPSPIDGSELRATADDTVSQAALGRVIEVVIPNRNLVDPNALALQAQIELLDRAIQQTIVFDFEGRDDLEVGMLVPINSTNANISGNFIVQQITSKQLSPTRTVYTVTVGNYVPKLADRLAALNNLQNGPKLIPAVIPPDNSVGTAQLQDNSVTSLQIAANAVNTEELNVGAVTADILASGAVTNTKVADNAISTPKLQAGSITTSLIAAGAVVASSIQAHSITGALIAAGSITAANAVFASGAIQNADIGNAQIQGAKIASATISGANIQTATITSANISSLNADLITAGTLNANLIAAGSIQGSQLANGSIGAIQLNGNVVVPAGWTLSANQITSGTISANMIGAGTISASISITSPNITSTNLGTTVTLAFGILSVTASGEQTTIEPDQVYCSATGFGFAYYAYNGVSLYNSSGLQSVSLSPSGLEVNNSSGSPLVNITASGNGQIQFNNGSNYALWGNTNKQKVVAGVGSFSSGSSTISSGLSSVTSAIAVQVTGGTPTDIIGASISGTNVTFKTSNSGGSGSFYYMIFGVA